MKMISFLLLFVLWTSCSSGILVQQMQYDDGQAEDGIMLPWNLGHAVVFTPPAKNWTLEKVAIVGLIGQNDGPFVLEVWDHNLNLLCRETDIASAYFSSKADWKTDWAEIDIPDTSIDGDFIVCLFGSSSFFLGVDLTDPAYNRSFVVSRSPNRFSTWNLGIPQNGSDWSIRVQGYIRSTAPSVDRIERIPEGKGVAVDARISDIDGDLTKAYLTVIDNETKDIVWMEQVRAEGAADVVSFKWPGKTFGISNNTGTLRPIYATKAPLATNYSQFMAFRANCMLMYSPTGPNLTAIAHFSDDGTFHAMTNSAGNFYYISQELFKVISPEGSYSDYMKENLSIKERESSLIFYRQLADGRVVAHPPMRLDRSPINHYMVRLDMADAKPGDYVVIVMAEDIAGNQAAALG
ncbi:MAG: hypothetical protein JW986_04750 [Methanotrichaceae archaeon]|nr:hypothetical protein [Methanotrichaceae archaeon]